MVSDKLAQVTKRWELIEDQLGSLEYYLLNDPFDQVDQQFAGQFAQIRAQLATVRVKYSEAKTSGSHPEVVSARLPSRQGSVSDEQAPMFPNDDFPPLKAGK